MYFCVFDLEVSKIIIQSLYQTKIVLPQLTSQISCYNDAAGTNSVTCDPAFQLDECSVLVKNKNKKLSLSRLVPQVKSKS
jgi:hypothetical protein